MSLKYHEIAETNHRILNPFTEAKLMHLGGMLDLHPGIRQLDIACGKGEMLCRWAAEWGISGTGIDLSHVFSQAAKDRAADLGVQDKVEFIQSEAVQYITETKPQGYDIVSCIGANWIGGGTIGTIELLKPALKPSPESFLLVGEIYWKEQPTQDAIDALGTTEGEWAVGLAGLLEYFDRAGTELVYMVVAQPDEWDLYETKHWLTVDRLLQENPDDPDIQGAYDFIMKDCRPSYFKYERELCSWGVFALRLKS